MCLSLHRPFLCGQQVRWRETGGNDLFQIYIKKKKSWLHINQQGYFPWLGKNVTVFLLSFSFGNPLKYTSQHPSNCQTCLYVNVCVIYLHVKTLTVTLYFTMTILPELQSQRKQIKQKADLYKQSFFFSAEVGESCCVLTHVQLYSSDCNAETRLSSALVCSYSETAF